MDKLHAGTPRTVNVDDDVDLGVVLDRVLECARELTGARYGALCVLNDARDGLERFCAVGLDQDARTGLGPLPRGRGVLGDLILDPVPVRLADIGEHPRFYGFPSGHPPMRSFLGVAILAGGTSVGSVYLTEKEGGTPFTETDERSIVALAGVAGRALDHARRHAEPDPTDRPEDTAPQRVHP